MRHALLEAARHALARLGGPNADKAKYGVIPFTTLALRKSRYAVPQYARDLAERLYYFPRDLRRRR